jgi:hypothetical protein
VEHDGLRVTVHARPPLVHDARIARCACVCNSIRTDGGRHDFLLHRPDRKLPDEVPNPPLA